MRLCLHIGLSTRVASEDRCITACKQARVKLLQYELNQFGLGLLAIGSGGGAAVPSELPGGVGIAPARLGFFGGGGGGGFFLAATAAAALVGDVGDAGFEASAPDEDRILANLCCSSDNCPV